LPADWWRGCDAPVVSRLRAAGSVLIGKSTTSEFACGLPDPTKGLLPDPTNSSLIARNPWNVDHSPEGSSSGTAVAVAAGMVLGGLGTDTSGSVRGPAAANGNDLSPLLRANHSWDIDLAPNL